MEAVPCQIQGIRSCPLSLYSYSQSFLTDAMRLVKQDFFLAKCVLVVFNHVVC